MVKKLKIALNRLLANQKHVRINMGGSIDHAGSIPEVKSGHFCSEIVKNEDFDGQFFSKFSGGRIQNRRCQILHPGAARTDEGQDVKILSFFTK